MIFHVTSYLLKSLVVGGEVLDSVTSHVHVHLWRKAPYSIPVSNTVRCGAE